jgi:hypothetical protein
MGQTAHHYLIFETAGGFCGIAWNNVGITRFQLPTRSAEAAERILLRRVPDANPGGYSRPDTIEHVVVEFDQPQTISRLVYEVEEAMRERTQEVRVEVSEDEARTYRQILVQEYNFSPQGATYQREEQRLDLHRVTHLRLIIVPNKNGSGTATLTALRLFA